MESKSSPKKSPAVADQGAVIKFSMPAGPESDEFYSNLVRKFGPDVVSRTVKEDCPAMNSRSKSSTTESVCSLSKIENVNEDFHQQLNATLKQDIDWNFIDFIIDYLLSSDKDGPQEADVDKLIQNYVKLNPLLREQLVTMLKNLAEGKEVRIEPSLDAATGIPRRSVKIKTDEVCMTSPPKTSNVSKSPSSSRSPKRPSPNVSNSALKTPSKSDVIKKPTPEPSKTPSSNSKDGKEVKVPNSSRVPEVESLGFPLTPPSTLKAQSNLFGDEVDSPSESPPRASEPPAPPPSPRSDQAKPQIGYLRVAGATSKALQLLSSEDHPIDDVALISTTPRRIDDSDCDEVFQFAGCTYDELLRLDSAPTKKKKKRNKKRNKRRPQSAVDDDLSVESSAAKPCPEFDEADASITDSIEDDRITAAIPPDDCAVNEAVDEECEPPSNFAFFGEPMSSETLDSIVAETCPLESPSTSSGHAAAVLLTITKPLQLVKDIESRAPMGLARTDILLEKEFKFQSVSQAECGVVTSWDDLKELVAEVFPNDTELQEAFATKAHNSLDLWKFIVKYGRMYKDFVSEVLEMVNELKKGLIGAMDMHREKTNEILETHKKEMCSVVEKARASDYRIEVLEKELEDCRLSADDQKVKAFTQEEEIQKLQKYLTAKDKKLRGFDNAKRDLQAERNKSKEEKERLTAEHEKTKSELLKAKSECESLRTRLKRSREGAEETDYKLRELESRLGDEQAASQKLKESNAKLTKKNEALQKELERLREKQARQRAFESAFRASTMPPSNVTSATDSSRGPPSRPVSSCSTSPSRSSFFPAPSAAYAAPQFTTTLYSSNYLSSSSRVVGSPSTKMFPQNNASQQLTMCGTSFSPADSGISQVSRASYAAASAGPPKDAFGQNFSYRDSALSTPRLPESDSEVHSLLTSTESPGKNKNDSSTSIVAGNGDRLMYKDSNEAKSKVIGAGLRKSKTEVADLPVSTSLPSFASLFTKDESPAQPEASYSPWGNSNYDFPLTTAPMFFNMKPSSLTVSPPGFPRNSSSRFPESDSRPSSQNSQKVVDQNATSLSKGFQNLFRS